MGRKIPGRKHHGVKDPEKQRAQRLDVQRANAPPSNADDQPIPKSVQRIAELMNKAKNLSKIQKTKKKENNKIKKKKIPAKQKKLIVVETKVRPNEKTVPKFEQLRGESDNAFLTRCNKICENVITEVDFEEKFGVQVKRNENTGKIENTVKVTDDPIKKMMKEARKEAKKKPKKKKNKDVVKLTKAEKRKLKLQMKKEKKQERETEEFERTDKVEFGEVLHAPPEMVLPKNAVKSTEPGRRNLLLKAIINGEEPKREKIPFSKSMNAFKKTSNKTIDKKGKRKNLPIGVRKQLDQNQKEIIEAYKLMKAKKRIVN